MSDVITPSRHVVPIPRAQNSASITPPWFVDKSEYTPKLATYRPLVNGKEAFGDVYHAIDAAKTSVCIICWGFQPSMYFVRDGVHLPIGALLERKAREGVMVRVLCWAFESTGNVNWIGADWALGESNTPGRWILSYGDRPITSTDEQYAYDCHWYRVYDRKQSTAGELRRQLWISDDYPKDKLLFVSRSYSSDDRAEVGELNYLDQGLSLTTKTTLKWFPSHHQKMVIVDYQEPQGAIGYVMGHNMLDGYWDSSEHGHLRTLPTHGRNGSSPLHDYSSRVTGPIVGDLFRNFASAWKRETGQALRMPAFETYPLRGDDPRTVCQILRTQPQYGRQDIKTCYLQAVANATQYIAIENQYFRWPPLADAIKAHALKMAQWGRAPEEHGSLYLFVITNTSDTGMGSGTVNTYRMLEALGRADRIPEVARHQRLEAIEKELEATNKAIAPLESERSALDSQARLLQGTPAPGLTERYARINDRLGPLEQRRRELEDAKARLEPKTWREKRFGSNRTPEAIVASEVPGLKVHVATLVAPDTPPGQAWQEVYIHAKLMMIDDAFMTAGSANINTRSMQVDSELNIAHHRPECTATLRAEQWARYTGGRVLAGMPLPVAFEKWGKLMDLNKVAKLNQQPPLAQLAEFLRISDKISNVD